ELVRKLILTGTGPAGGKGIDKVATTTYYDTLRATLTRQDPKEFLFFNRDDIGKRAARAFVERLEERTEDRDSPITQRALTPQRQRHKPWGPPTTGRPARDPPADLGRQRRQRPHGPHPPLRRHAPSDSWLEPPHLPHPRPRRDLPVPPRIRFYRN